MNAPDRSVLGADTTIAFAGTPDEAATVLEALFSAGFQIDVVLTAPDRRRGRGSGTSPSPVKAMAQKLGLPVTHEMADLKASSADIGVVVAYGYIIPADVLEAFPMVNLHFSLLPRWRGAAPVERAILAGDTETGVCVMEVAEGLDTGGVFASLSTPVAHKTSRELRTELTVAGAELLVESLVAGLQDPVPQAGEPTYAAKIDNTDREIDWNAEPSVAERIVRIGGAWTMVGGKRLKIHQVTLREPADPSQTTDVPSTPPVEDPSESSDSFWVACGGEEIGLVNVQPEGKRPMAAREWANGARIIEHDRLQP